eukprot:2506581-Rhodomonas_salina.4
MDDDDDDDDDDVDVGWVVVVVVVVVDMNGTNADISGGNSDDGSWWSAVQVAAAKDKSRKVKRASSMRVIDPGTTIDRS